MRMLSDRALGARVVAGDRAAFAELFRRYRQSLYGYCVSILGNQDDSADALQNTMTKALKSLPGEERDLQLKAWLFRVAHNECIDLMRLKKPTDDIAEVDLPSKRGVEAEVAGRERLRELLGDLEHLPEKQRSALVMRELNGLSFEEIGSALDATPSASKQVVYEARLSLQEYAEGRNMDCDAVREAISDRDGRVLRGRKMRAHLRNCSACRDFKAGIETRRHDLRAFIPPIPAAMAAALVDLLNGPGGGGAAGLAGLAGLKAALGGSGAKAVAIVAATATVGAGSVGVVELKRHDDAANRSSKSATTSSSTGPVQTAPAAIFNGGSKLLRPGAGAPNRTDPRGSAPGREGKASGDDGHSKPDSSPAQVPDSPGNSGSSGGGTGSTYSPGGSGGSKGLGAVPTHGGKPAQLPDAAAGGQQQAADAQAQGGQPASLGNSASAGPVKPVEVTGSGK